ncbi:hypothetical protein Efla_002890 [Eimeria flavescens]
MATYGSAETLFLSPAPTLPSFRAAREYLVHESTTRQARRSPSICERSFMSAAAAEDPKGSFSPHQLSDSPLPMPSLRRHGVRSVSLPGTRAFSPCSCLASPTERPHRDDYFLSVGASPTAHRSSSPSTPSMGDSMGTGGTGDVPTSASGLWSLTTHPPSRFGPCDTKQEHHEKDNNTMINMCSEFCLSNVSSSIDKLIMESLKRPPLARLSESLHGSLRKYRDEVKKYDDQLSGPFLAPSLSDGAWVTGAKIAALAAASLSPRSSLVSSTGEQNTTESGPMRSLDDGEIEAFLKAKEKTEEVAARIKKEVAAAREGVGAFRAQSNRPRSCIGRRNSKPFESSGPAFVALPSPRSRHVNAHKGKSNHSRASQPRLPSSLLGTRSSGSDGSYSSQGKPTIQRAAIAKGSLDTSKSSNNFLALGVRLQPVKDKGQGVYQNRKISLTQCHTPLSAFQRKACAPPLPNEVLKKNVPKNSPFPGCSTGKLLDPCSASHRVSGGEDGHNHCDSTGDKGTAEASLSPCCAARPVVTTASTNEYLPGRTEKASASFKGQASTKAAVQQEACASSPPPEFLKKNVPSNSPSPGYSTFDPCSASPRVSNSEVGYNLCDSTGDKATAEASLSPCCAARPVTTTASTNEFISRRAEVATICYNEEASTKAAPATSADKQHSTAAATTADTCDVLLTRQAFKTQHHVTPLNCQWKGQAERSTLAGKNSPHTSRAHMNKVWPVLTHKQPAAYRHLARILKRVLGAAAAREAEREAFSKFMWWRHAISHAEGRSHCCLIEQQTLRPGTCLFAYAKSSLAGKADSTPGYWEEVNATLSAAAGAALAAEATAVKAHTVSLEIDRKEEERIQTSKGAVWQANERYLPQIMPLQDPTLPPRSQQKAPRLDQDPCLLSVQKLAQGPSSNFDIQLTGNRLVLEASSGDLKKHCQQHIGEFQERTVYEKQELHQVQPTKLCQLQPEGRKSLEPESRGRVSVASPSSLRDCQGRCCRPAGIWRINDESSQDNSRDAACQLTAMLSACACWKQDRISTKRAERKSTPLCSATSFKTTDFTAKDTGSHEVTSISHSLPQHRRPGRTPPVDDSCGPQRVKENEEMKCSSEKSAFEGKPLGDEDGWSKKVRGGQRAAEAFQGLHHSSYAAEQHPWREKHVEIESQQPVEQDSGQVQNELAFQKSQSHLQELRRQLGSQRLEIKRMLGSHGLKLSTGDGQLPAASLFQELQQVRDVQKYQERRCLAIPERNAPHQLLQVSGQLVCGNRQPSSTIHLGQQEAKLSPILQKARARLQQEEFQTPGALNHHGDKRQHQQELMQSWSSAALCMSLSALIRRFQSAVQSKAFHQQQSPQEQRIEQRTQNHRHKSSERAIQKPVCSEASKQAMRLSVPIQSRPRSQLARRQPQRQPAQELALVGISIMQARQTMASKPRLLGSPSSHYPKAQSSRVTEAAHVVLGCCTLIRSSLKPHGTNTDAAVATSSGRLEDRVAIRAS